MKIKDKNNYETKVTTIDGYCGAKYEENEEFVVINNLKESD